MHLFTPTQRKLLTRREVSNSRPSVGWFTPTPKILVWGFNDSYKDTFVWGFTPFIRYCTKIFTFAKERNKPIITRPLVLLIALGVICNLILWGFTIFYFFRSTDLVPLHYTIYFGIDLFDTKYRLFVYPLFGSIILVINGIVLYIVKKEILLTYILSTVIIFCQIIIFITEWALVSNFY